METKSPLETMQEVTYSLRFSQAVFVPPVGAAGGICFGWKPGVDIEPTFQNQNLINLLVFSDPPNKPWMLSAIYGPPYKKTEKKILGEHAQNCLIFFWALVMFW